MKKLILSALVLLLAAVFVPAVQSAELPVSPDETAELETSTTDAVMTPATDAQQPETLASIFDAIEGQQCLDSGRFCYTTADCASYCSLCVCGSSNTCVLC